MTVGCASPSPGVLARMALGMNDARGALFPSGDFFDDGSGAHATNLGADGQAGGNGGNGGAGGTGGVGGPGGGPAPTPPTWALTVKPAETAGMVGLAGPVGSAGPAGSANTAESQGAPIVHRCRTRRTVHDLRRRTAAAAVDLLTPPSPREHPLSTAAELAEPCTTSVGGLRRLVRFCSNPPGCPREPFGVVRLTLAGRTAPFCH